ncbi:MAG TPA: Maf family nucleotide pyrophosphatase [Planctomycetota bacterium]|nr:Maf family nucleotide pyrophosphatase [Planctomycetota bacterium]HRR78613.1 Maf family nucleotide pyrophosphatase [Planctomycetota bacterium]HRT94847.1 Maf family nucleotide pyrophosphatase [Planctomycetota bacterium]
MQLRRSKLILASASPRRRQLLAQLGYTFEVVPPEVDESVDPALAPARQAEALAVRKAESVAPRVGDAVILAADTLVACEGRVIGKPADEAQAREFLRWLTTHRHAVITGVCVLDTVHGTRQVAHDITWVRMTPMTEAELDGYIASCGWRDKAGAYAIQEGGDRFIQSIEGSETNVIGLPTELVEKLVPRLFGEHLRKLRRDTVAQHRGLLLTEDDLAVPDSLARSLGRQAAPLEVEIGPGKDDFTLRAAKASPVTCFLAVERVRERVDSLCRKIERAKLSNVRVYFGDAGAAIAGLLKPGSVQAFHIHFPDPWPKRRHARHRLIQPATARQLAERLRPGGTLTVITDDRPYAEQILACLGAVPCLVNRVGPGQWATELPGYHQSVYERKRRAAGCVIYYLLFAKAASSEERERP